jgi:hypothetical protein
MPILKQTEVRKLMKAHDRRCGDGFMGALEHVFHKRLTALLEAHNGGKKTLTAESVHAFFGTKP